MCQCNLKARTTFKCASGALKRAARFLLFDEGVRREDSNAIEARLRTPDAEVEPDGQESSATPEQTGGDNELFAALGNALDEIEAEERAEKKEIFAPTLDRVEITPALDTEYKRMTRSFICSVDPPLSVTTRERTKHGQLVDAFDKTLEDLLNDSLLRARHTFEQRRALDVRGVGRNR